MVSNPFLSERYGPKSQGFIALRSLVLREIVMNEPASQCYLDFIYESYIRIRTYIDYSSPI